MYLCHRFSSIGKKALVPFALVAKGYLLFDDLVWHSVTRVTEKIEDKTGITRRQLSDLTFAPCGINFLLASFYSSDIHSPLFSNLLSGLGMLMLGGSISLALVRLRMPKTTEKDWWNDSDIEIITSSSRSWRLLAIIAGISETVAFHEYAPHFYSGQMTASLGLIFYLIDNEGNGTLRLLKEETTPIALQPTS